VAKKNRNSADEKKNRTIFLKSTIGKITPEIWPS
jgi:hypothetical protein